MRGKSRLALPSALLLAVSCTSVSPPTLPPSQPSPQSHSAERSQAPVETVVIVAGTPTEIYAQVARGALRCWLGADGPLKPSHVFHAEAEPAATGGAAEIILHERDESLRDKRGARAFHVSISSAPAGVRVAAAPLKVETQLGQYMVRDVVGWAKGGTDCEVRRQAPPQLTPAVGSADLHPAKKKR